MLMYKNEPLGKGELDILSTKEGIMANTDSGKVADALVAKSVIDSLTAKVDGFTDSTYQAVTGLAYDATNKKLGLKVGADTVIPFNSVQPFSCSIETKNSWLGFTFDVTNYSKFKLTSGISTHEWYLYKDGTKTNTYTKSNLNQEINISSCSSIYVCAQWDASASFYFYN